MTHWIGGTRKRDVMHARTMDEKQAKALARLIVNAGGRAEAALAPSHNAWVVWDFQAGCFIGPEPKKKTHELPPVCVRRSGAIERDSRQIGSYIAMSTGYLVQVAGRKVQVPGYSEIAPTAGVLLMGSVRA